MADNETINASKNRADFGQLGDCAKLREALKLYDRIIQDRTLICDCDIVCGARTLARSALSAPPRNCDAPLVVDGPADNNADKAWIVFKRHNPDAYFDVSGLLRCIDWLLSHATEGGDK